MTLKGGTSQACAACKHQRRRCKPDCTLAPYFPPDQQQIFQNCHRLYGVSNIVKIIKSLDESQRGEAMKTIKYEAYMRDKYPVHGCLTVISHLTDQIAHYERELYAVYQQLEMYRQHNQQQQQAASMQEDMPSQLELAMAPPNNHGGFSVYDQGGPHACNDVNPLPLGHPHNSIAGFMDCNKDNINITNPLWVPQPHASNACDNPMANQPQLAASQQSLPIQEEVVHGYDEVDPIVDTIDDQQSYMDSKRVYETSSDGSMKDRTQAIEHVGQNELINAAACFSLTSVN